MPPDLKAEVWAELRRGKDIAEAYLQDTSGRTYVHGVCMPDGSVMVNPVPSTVDTIIHELIHRRRPRWGEKRVRAETRKIMRGLSDREQLRWYRQYTKAAQVEPAVVKVED